MEEDNEMTRWRKVFRRERKTSLKLGMTEVQANDRGQVAAWLDNLSRTNRLRIERYIEDGINRVVRHRVHILDNEDDDDAYATECGGSLDMSAIEWHDEWPFRADSLGYGCYEIHVMIKDVIPEHDMFKRPDGTAVDLGFNYDPYFASFCLEINGRDLVGDF